MKKTVIVFLMLFVGILIVSARNGSASNLSTYQSEQKVVEVKGAIVKAGIYEVPWDATVEDILAIAGGIREDGSVDALNLTQVPANQSVIVIPQQSAEACISINSASVEELDRLPRHWTKDRPAYSGLPRSSSLSKS